MKNTVFILSLIPYFATFGQTQAAMNEEAKKAHNLADKEMTLVYKTLMSNLTTQGEKDLLLAAQRAWITYKEAHCKALAHQYEGGSMMPLIYYNCLEEMTRQRMEQLNAYGQ
ncbi:MAG: hypothetical protein RL432_1710 [Bacteroidota bacterium]|jgi:uncharacterized protein YecT (DUF1311 family)